MTLTYRPVRLDNGRAAVHVQFPPGCGGTYIVDLGDGRWASFDETEHPTFPAALAHALDYYAGVQDRDADAAHARAQALRDLAAGPLPQDPPA